MMMGQGVLLYYCISVGENLTHIYIYIYLCTSDFCRLASIEKPWRWNELVTLSAKYRDLTANAHLALTVSFTLGLGEDENLGRTYVPIAPIVSVHKHENVISKNEQVNTKLTFSMFVVRERVRPRQRSLYLLENVQLGQSP